jgi:hypothetical protein
VLRPTLALLCSLWFPIFLSGCLSNSYYVRRDELVRLSTLEPQDRWQSVRAVQEINGDDYPASDDSALYSSPYRPTTVYFGTVVVDSHHHGWCPPPRSSRPQRTLSSASVAPPPSGTPIQAAGSGMASKKGNGNSAAAAAVAAAVVVGATAGFTLAASEGARYDGWLAVHQDEPLHLRLRNGSTMPIRLSSLTPDEAAEAEGAIVYEGNEGRFPRLGRAPLDRSGFTLTTALHMGGVPQLDRPVGTGAGGYLHIGGNIGGVVTLGLAATADSGLDTRHSTLLATLGPEVQIFPLHFLGFYAGAGWSFRNTGLDWGTRADEGWMIRGGAVGELTLTTRLALQARAGVVRHDFASGAPITWEGQLGLAIY